LEFADLTSSVFTGIITLDRFEGTAGRFFESDDPDQPHLFLPAAGLRASGNGSLGFPNSFGYYWSSTPNSDPNAWGLTFSTTPVNSNYSPIKANGFSVRCVAEL
jgi:hypothetical protein